MSEKTTVPNLRDIGGMTTRDHRTVAFDRVLRSGAPQASDAPTEPVTWPPALVVDLTSPGELHETHPLASPSVTVVNLPLLECLGHRAGSHDTLDGFYFDLISSGASLLVELVETVADSPGTTLIHCAAGKDRTGLAISLILSLLQVRRSDILRDYNKSADSYAQIDTRLRTIDSKGPIAAPPAALMRVSDSAMTSILDFWGNRSGVRSIGTSRAAADVRRFRT